MIIFWCDNDWSESFIGMFFLLFGNLFKFGYIDNSWNIINDISEKMREIQAYRE